MKSWKEMTQNVSKLLKQVSDFYGGDDVEWLRGYYHQLLADHSTDLQPVLDALEDMARVIPGRGYGKRMETVEAVPDRV
jgi:hypothetical protein